MSPLSRTPMPRRSSRSSPRLARRRPPATSTGTPRRRRRPAIDSNGAGDAYVSGFLHAWLAGGDANVAARTGAVAGAWACGTAGTHASPIGADELTRQLERVGHVGDRSAGGRVS